MYLELLQLVLVAVWLPCLLTFLYLRSKITANTAEHQSIRDHNARMQRIEYDHAEHMAKIEKMGVQTIRSQITEATTNAIIRKIDTQGLSAKQQKEIRRHHPEYIPWDEY